MGWRVGFSGSTSASVAAILLLTACTANSSPTATISAEVSPSATSTAVPTPPYQTAAVVARVPFPHPDSQAPSIFRVAVTDGALWVADARGEYLVRIDLESNQVTSTVPTDTASLAAGDGRLWSIGPLSGAGGPPPSTISLGRVDLVSGTVEVVAQVPRGAVAVGLGAVWMLRTSPMKQSMAIPRPRWSRSILIPARVRRPGRPTERIRWLPAISFGLLDSVSPGRS
jgi:hypothetical protein